MTAAQVSIGLLVVAALGLVSIWTSGAKAGRRASQTARGLGTGGGTAGRAVLTAAIIVGVQWAVVTHTDNAAVIAAVLGVPALIAGTTVARLVAVTEMAATLARTGGRR